MKKKPTSTRLVKTLALSSKKAGMSRDAMVAEKAYFMYLDQGRPNGFDVHHWLMAEAEVNAC